MTLAAITMTAPKPPALCRMYRATYSPDDNKLRLLPRHGLTRRRIKKCMMPVSGWAPRQALFVAPARHRAGKTRSHLLPERLRMKTARSLNVRKHGRSGLPDTAEKRGQ